MRQRRGGGGRARRRAPAPCPRATAAGAASPGRASARNRRSPCPSSPPRSPAPAPCRCRWRAGSRRRASRRARRRRNTRPGSACRSGGPACRPWRPARCRCVPALHRLLQLVEPEIAGHRHPVRRAIRVIASPNACASSMIAARMSSARQHLVLSDRQRRRQGEHVAHGGLEGQARGRARRYMTASARSACRLHAGAVAHQLDADQEAAARARRRSPGCAPCSSSSRASATAPTRAAFSTRPSSSMISMVVSAARAVTGFFSCV